MIELEFECSNRWEDFVGDDPFKRHCTECDHLIHNVSALTRDEARKFLRERQEGGGRLCITFVSRSGSTVFADDPERRLRKQRSGVRSLVLAAAAISPLLILGCEEAPTAEAQSAAYTAPATPGGVARHAATERPGYDAYKRAETAPPCDANKSAIDRATAKLAAMYDDLFGEEPPPPQEVQMAGVVF